MWAWGVRQIRALGGDRLDLNSCAALLCWVQQTQLDTYLTTEHAGPTPSFQKARFQLSHISPLGLPPSQSLKSIPLRTDIARQFRSLRHKKSSSQKLAGNSPLKNDRPGREVSSAAGFDYAWMWSLKQQHHLSTTGGDTLRTEPLHWEGHSRQTDISIGRSMTQPPFQALRQRFPFLHQSPTQRARPRVKALE